MKIFDIVNESSDLEAEQLAAVQRNGYAINHIANPSPAVQLAAVQDAPDAIQYITNPSVEVQVAAMQQDGWAIKHISDPSLAVQLAAVKNDPEAIVSIEDPDEHTQMLAVELHPQTIRYIDNPTKEVALTAIINLIDVNKWKAIETLHVMLKAGKDWPELRILAEELNQLDLLVFTSDSVIQDILTQYHDLLLDSISEIISDWEASDDYYYTWLREQGYVDEETDEVDWDNAPSYFEYNTDARDAYNTLVHAITITPDEIRQVATAHEHDTDDDMTNISQLEPLVVSVLKDKASRSDGMSQLVTFIQQHTALRWDRAVASGWRVVKI